MSETDEREPTGSPELDLPTRTERWGWDRRRSDRIHHRDEFGGAPGLDSHDHADDELPGKMRGILNPAEIHATVMHQHPAALAAPFLVLIGALAAAIALNSLAYVNHQASPILVHVLWLGFAIAAAWYSWRALQWHKTWYVFTPRRMIRVSGWPSKQVVALPWRRCRDLEMMQPVAGRLLGYGTLVAPSVGTGHALSQVPYVPDVEQVYRMIWAILEPAKGKSPMPEEVE